MKDYVASIRKLAMECEFAGKLDDNLTDRLVYRINDETVQHQMLSEANLVLEKPIAIATMNEATKKHVG